MLISILLQKAYIRLIFVRLASVQNFSILRFTAWFITLIEYDICAIPLLY